MILYRKPSDDDGKKKGDSKNNDEKTYSSRVKYPYDADAVVAMNSRVHNIPTSTPKGTFRCSGSALDYASNCYNWRKEIVGRLKENGKPVPSGYTNAWNFKKSALESGAGKLYYSRERDGELTEEDIENLRKRAPDASIFGWGDVRGKYGFHWNMAETRSRHITSVAGVDKDGEPIMYNLGGTSEVDEGIDMNIEAYGDSPNWILVPKSYKGSIWDIRPAKPINNRRPAPKFHGYRNDIDISKLIK